MISLGQRRSATTTVCRSSRSILADCGEPEELNFSSSGTRSCACPRAVQRGEDFTENDRKSFFLTVRVDVRVRVECSFASSLSRHRGKHVCLRGSRSLKSVPESTLLRPPPIVHNSRLTLSWTATSSRAEVWFLSISCGAGHSVLELRCASGFVSSICASWSCHDRGPNGCLLVGRPLVRAHGQCL